MKVVYHQVAPTAHESFRVLEMRGSNAGCSWHFHPEYQIGLMLSGAGHRIVGDNLSPLDPGDLSLLGPNLPHVWPFDDEGHLASPEVHAIVVYFTEGVFGEGFLEMPESRGIKRLLERSKSGLAVSGTTRRLAAKLVQEMAGHQGMQRVIDLVQLLHLLSGSDELAPICSAGFMPELPDVDGERLRRVTEHVQQHLAEPILRDEMAALASLSPAAFSRFFKSRTGKTFQDFVTELRIGYACRLLAGEEHNVTEVALMSGFGSVASFNRAFRRLKGASPSGYRKRMASYGNN